MKHPLLNLALVAGAAAFIVYAVKKTKEAMKKQAEVDAAMAEEAVAEELKKADKKDEEAE